MPTINENKETWDGAYGWHEGGDEWSVPWGGAAMQWHASILPRVHRFLPAANILEIAPGYGRWTQFLIRQCERMSAVDLSRECVESCVKRFAGESIALYVNDGSSLAMVGDAAFDFIFSFDSLVHVEADVLEAYIRQIADKLTDDGVAFLHHSNMGEYLRYIRMLERWPKGKDRLINWGVLDPLEPLWRARSVTAKKTQRIIDAAGLHCVSQELVNWRMVRRLSDCFTTLTRKHSKWAAPTQLVRNPYFVRETNYWGALAVLYA